MIGMLAAASMLPPPRLEVSFFLLEGCPIARKYAPEIKKIGADYQGRVKFQIVHVDPTTDAADASAFAKEFGYTFPFKLDTTHSLAKTWGVKNVPTAVVYAGANAVYSGRIDDRFPALGVQREVRRRDLRIALDEALSGRKVSVPRTPVIGCLLPTRS